MTSKLLKTVFISIGAIGLAIWTYLYAVGTYALESKFTSDDAAPIADPYTTEPGGQEVDVVDVEGSKWSIASDYLIAAAQGTPVDGEMGLRHTSSIGIFAGRTLFLKFKPTNMTNGIAGQDQLSNAFGFTTQTDVTIDDLAKQGFGWNSVRFTSMIIEDTDSYHQFFVAPTTTDTFWVAVVMGGNLTTGTIENDATPWYSGVNAASYLAGYTVFVKKGAAGIWKIASKNVAVEEANSYPAISNYNSTFRLDYWAVSNDTLRNAYLQPIHYQAGNFAAGQLFDDTPEVGAAFDSVHGDWQGDGSDFTSTGSDPGAMDWITTVNMSESNVFGEVVISGNNGGNDRAGGIVLRRNSSTNEFITVVIETNASSTADLTINTFNGTSYTQRAITNSFGNPATSAFYYLAAWVCDSTVWGLAYYSAAASNAMKMVTYTSAANTFYSSNNTRHGLYKAIAGSGEMKFARFYPAGDATQYEGFDAYFPDLASTTNNTILGRRRMISTQ